MPALDPSPFRHGLFAFDDVAELPAVVVPFILQGMGAGDLLVVEVSPAVRSILDGALSLTPVPGEDLLGDTTSHPQQMIWSLRQLLDERDPVTRQGRALRVVSQIDYAEAHDSVEWARAEAAANHVFHDLPVRALCLYDASELSPEVMREAERSHPHLVDRRGARPNPAYLSPAAHLRALDAPVQPHPLERLEPAVALDLADRESLSTLRAELTKVLEATPLSETRRAEFLDAVFEVSANALLFGGDDIKATVWCDAQAVLFRITDSGPGLPDPLTGYEPPGPGKPRGFGLWVARQLCDRMTTSIDHDGFTARLWALLSEPAQV